MNDNAKKSKGTLVAVIVLVVLVAAAGILYMVFGRQATTAGEKKVTVTVVHKDKTSKDFEYQTDAEYLGEVIVNEGLVEGSDSEYGMFITTVDGETADEGKQEWWCLTKAGEMLNTSADKTPIADGETFELTLTEGY